jgi:hypothetical protein
MRKLANLICLLLVCLLVASPVLAAGGIFVPSIGYKEDPGIDDAEGGGEDVGPCLVVTSILEAREKTTDIYQEDRDLLLEVYEDLSDGSMKLPLDDDYVIRELVDVSWRKTTCVEAEHGHKQWLHEENTSIKVTFDLGVEKTTDVIVLVYLDGKWEKVPAVNNGNGTITCEFEDICPVVFCVDPNAETGNPVTGDVQLGRVIFWAVLMAASMAALVVLLVGNQKKKRRHGR